MNVDLSHLFPPCSPSVSVQVNHEEQRVKHSVIKPLLPVSRGTCLPGLSARWWPHVWWTALLHSTPPLSSSQAAECRWYRWRTPTTRCLLKHSWVRPWAPRTPVPTPRLRSPGNWPSTCSPGGSHYGCKLPLEPWRAPSPLTVLTSRPREGQRGHSGRSAWCRTRSQVPPWAWSRSSGSA